MVQKRASSTIARAPAAKKPRASAVDRKVRGVVEAIQEAAGDLSASCKEMLVAIAPLSLGVASDERDQYQHSAVKLMEQWFASTRETMTGAVATEGAKVVDVQASKDNLLKQLGEAEAIMAGAAEEVETRKVALSRVTALTVAAKKAVAAARAAQQDGDAAVSATRREMDDFAAAIDDHFRPIRAGEADAAQAKKRLSALMPFIKKLNLDASLVSAMPATCAKGAEARSDFENVVLGELERGLAGKVAELAAIVEAAAPAAAEREAATTAAEIEWEGHNAAQQAAAAELSSAQASHKEAADAAAAAKAAVAENEPAYRSSMEVFEAAKDTLEQFEAYPITCFESLRDRVAVREEHWASKVIEECEEPEAAQAGA